MATNKKIFIEIITKTSGAEKGLDNVGNAADKSGKKAEQASKSFLGLGRTFTAIARGFVIVKSFQLLSQAIGGAIRVSAQFELAMNKVRATTKATEKQFDELKQAARELALGTMFTATQVAELQLAYSKLGFTTEEILNATEATLDLATATGEDLAGAADVVGSTIRGFNLDAVEAGRVADIMAASFTSSALSLESFRQSMKTVAPIANAANIGLEETTAMLSVLADSGLRGTRAATGLKNLLSQLANPTSDLAQFLGYTVNNAEGAAMAFEELSKSNVDLAKATGLTDERSKAAFLTLIRGKDAVKALTEAYKESRGAAEEMADTVEESVSIKLDKFFSAIEVFAESNSGALMVSIGRLLDEITTFINSTDPATAIINRADIAMKEFTGGVDLAEISTEKLNAKIKELKDSNNELTSSIEASKTPLQELQELQGKDFAAAMGEAEELTKAQKERLEELTEQNWIGSSAIMDLTAQKEVNNKVSEDQVKVNEKILLQLEKEIKLRNQQRKDGGDPITPILGDSELAIEKIGELSSHYDDFVKKISSPPAEAVEESLFRQLTGDLLESEVELRAFQDTMNSFNDLYQTILQNRSNAVIAENDREMNELLQNQDDYLAEFDVRQQHELNSFVGTQQQKADFEKQNELERLEIVKKQRAAEEKLRKQQLAEENKIAREAFKANKVNALANIAINTAIAIAKAPAEGLILGAPALAALIAAGGAAQSAAVLAQKFQPKTFEEGGSIVGPSHSEGGVPFTVAGSAGFEAEGGEYIFSRKTVDRLGTGLLDAINFGGATPRMFADGGVVSASSVSQNAFGGMEMAEMIGSIIAQTVTEIPVVNVATDTLNTGRAVQSAQDMASF